MRLKPRVSRFLLVHQCWNDLFVSYVQGSVNFVEVFDHCLSSIRDRVANFCFVSSFKRNLFFDEVLVDQKIQVLF